MFGISVWFLLVTAGGEEEEEEGVDTSSFQAFGTKKDRKKIKTNLFYRAFPFMAFPFRLRRQILATQFRLICLCQEKGAQLAIFE